MSNVNINEPFQLIRFRQGKFQVPPETASFLKDFKNPLGIITIVGKYRTGKSLFLNKVLLRNSTFKVSPTINSCTKGLWMCRETLRADNAEQTDILVVDTQGFGATQESDQYNNRILLFSMLLSSYFIYNSVGSIDENSLNSLNLVAQLARELLKNNSKDQKIDEDSPSFLWLVRDFALNLVDKNGGAIQPRQYLEQALQIQKGSSDAIQNKNKIRRMIKHFFKDRDCFTMVRPVQSQENLQNLLYLPDSCLRAQFLQQVQQLRSKILKKVKGKRIKGRSLDGQALVELANSYVQIINRGELPNLQVSYKHIMRFQLDRTYRNFIDCCKSKIGYSSSKMHSKSNLDLFQVDLLRQLEGRFREGAFEAGEMKVAVQRGKKQIQQLMEDFCKQNYNRCLENCNQMWESLYDSSKTFDSSQQIDGYFGTLAEEFIGEIKGQNNPVEQSHVRKIVLMEKTKKMSELLSKVQIDSSNQLNLRDKKIEELLQLTQAQKKQVQHLQQQNHRLNRQLNKSTGRCSQIQNVKNMEIVYLKQKQSERNHQIQQILVRYEQTARQLEDSRSSLLELQIRNQQANRSLRQTSEDKRLTEKQLEIIRHNLQAKTQEASQLKTQLSQTTVRLEHALEKQVLIQSKNQHQMEHRNQQYSNLLRKNQSQLQQIHRLNIQVQRITIQLQNNSTLLYREKSIYENMFDSFKQSLKLEGTSRQELIQTNKNLSAAIKHLQKRAQNAEQKEKQLKQYKKCVKNASCLQCHHCTKFFVPSIFLPHLNVCLIGPQALKSTKLQLRNDHRSKLQIRIKQTLVKQSQGKPYTEYLIEFKSDKKEWSVSRKYKAFCDLNSWLKAALPGVQLSEVSYIVNPQEVSKKSLVIEERRKILQKYLNDLEMNPLVAVTNLWAEFIEYPVSESVGQSLSNSPLKENKRVTNQEQTPEQFFKVWNQRKMRGKQSAISNVKKSKGVRAE